MNVSVYKSSCEAQIIVEAGRSNAQNTRVSREKAKITEFVSKCNQGCDEAMYNQGFAGS